MQTAMTVMPAYARRALTNAAMSVAVAAAAATLPTQAESRERDVLLSLPAARTEVAPAAAVVSEGPFQKFLQLKCSGDPANCSARLAPVQAKERLVIQFISCSAVMTVAGTLRNFSAAVTDAAITKLFAGHFIVPAYQSNGPLYIYVGAQPTPLIIDANRTLVLETASFSGAITGASCGVSGVRQKLG